MIATFSAAARLFFRVRVCDGVKPCSVLSRSFRPATLVALGALLNPHSAGAEAVTFKATLTVAAINDNSSGYAATFLQQFPIGTPIEVEYTFESTTTDSRSDPNSSDFAAITSVTVRLGSHTSSGTIGNIGVENDLTGAIVGGLCADPANRPSPFLIDIYWVDVPTLAGAEPVAGFTAASIYFQLAQDCAAGQNPGNLFNSDALPLIPFALGVQSPQLSNSLNWYSTSGDRVDLVLGPITSLTLVPASNTTTGANVAVSPTVTLPNGSAGNVSLTFDSVESAGATTVTATSTPANGVSASPNEFKAGQPPVYYDVVTTASFTGNVTLCFSWQEGHFHNESAVHLFHYENGAWIDVTTSLDTTANRVCGQVSSLSPFGLFEPSYAFTGFFQPVDNSPTRNTIKAGSAIPVRFSLNGNQGLSIFDAGYPASQLRQCETTAPLDSIEETATAGGSSLSYDSNTGRYTYVWKTDKSWAGSCRRLLLQFNDGSLKYADFSFSK